MSLGFKIKFPHNNLNPISNRNPHLITHTKAALNIMIVSDYEQSPTKINTSYFRNNTPIGPPLDIRSI